ncbi:hypothetical protein Barb4_03009 [Bacteroidales bacterium Barb4]|nr:hypothetical protein Barb4_03009 [Bacteroidales bacterium Barb4]
MLLISLKYRKSILKAAVISSLLCSGIYSARAAEVDKSAAVAAIGVESDVTPSGSVAYSIAFESYQATYGPQPSLGLTYSSVLGDAVAGRGWSLVGISAIVRTHRNLYYDNISRAPQDDVRDPFMLDGIRLIRKTDNITDATSVINYVQEQGLNRIKAYVSGNAIRYFEVFYPNGAVATFGFSKNTLNNNVYPLTKIKDRFGDCMDLEYIYSDNRYLLSEVKYFYVNGTARCKVYCDYKLRTELLSFYERGKGVTEDLLLSSVTTYFDDTPLRTYRLGYEMIYNTSVLTSVSLNVRGAEVNPVRFSYGTGKKPLDFHSETVQLPNWDKKVEPGRLYVHQGKFESGNDNTGFIFYEADGAYVIDGDHYTNHYNENALVRVYANLTSQAASTYGSFSMGEGFVDCFPANFDNGSVQGIIKVNTKIVDNEEKITFTAYSLSLQNEEFYENSKYTRTYMLPLAKSGGVIPKTFQPVDFDGDGIDEIFITTQNAPLGDKNLTSMIYILGLHDIGTLYAGIPKDYKYNIELPSFKDTEKESKEHYENSDRLFMSDFDGDGQIDLSVINNDGLYTFSVLKSDDVFTIEPILTRYSDLTRKDLIGHDIFLGNLNADRCTDIVLAPEKGTKAASRWWTVLCSNGKKGFEFSQFESVPNSSGYSFFLHDVNSDGLSDLVCIREGGNGEKAFEVRLTKDGVFSDKVPEEQLPAYSKLFTSDITTHSRIPDQLLALDPTGRVTKYYFLQNGVEDLLLTTFTNSYGVEEHSEYALVDTKVSSFYTPGIGAIATDYENLNAGIRVVTHKTVTYKNKTYSSLAYRYEHGIYHKRGLGFLGFAKFMEADSIKNVSKTTYYNHIDGKGVIDSMETFAYDEKVYQVKNTWKIAMEKDRTLKIHQLKSQTVDILKEDTVTVTFGEYDAYDNLLSQTTDYGNGLSESVSTTYENVSNDSLYLAGIPLMQESISRNLQSSFPVSKDSTVYKYDKRYLPTTIERFKEGDNRVSEEVKEYDKAGRCIVEKNRSYEQAIPFETSYEYNDLGFQVAVTDPLGHKSTAKYDNRSGAIIKATDHRGNSVLTDYDEFDRVLWVKNPDGSISTASYFWCKDESKGLYAQATEKSNGEKAVEYYDALNRAIRTEAVRFDGKTVCTVTKYDEKGRPSTSYPFIE